MNSHLEYICREKHLSPIKINMHTHDFDELTYYIEGNGSTSILSKSYPYKTGSFAFYRTGTRHDETNPEPCDVIWTHLSFHIDGVELKEGVFEDSHGELLVLLQRLKRASVEQHQFSRQMTESILSQVIITAAKLQSMHPSAAHGLNWQEILESIDENLTNPIDFTTLAEKYGYSYDRFRHLFKERFGITLYAYVLEQRIRHAAYLLKHSSRSLTEIAYNCGFSSSSQFSNIFKKHMQKTPGEYRKSGV